MSAADNRIEKFKENPFRVKTLLQEGHSKDEKMGINPETGELSMRIVSKGSPWNDPDKFLKVYGEGIRVLKLLSAPGIHLWEYVVTMLPPKRDVITIDKNDAMVYCGFKTPKTFDRAIRNLIDNRILAKRDGFDVAYFINPNMFFNGKRNAIMDVETAAHRALSKSSEGAIRMNYRKKKQMEKDFLDSEEERFKDFFDNLP